MSWTDVKQAIRESVAKVADMDLRAVTWKDKPDASANRIVKLDVVHAAQEMRDRKVKTQNATTGNTDVEISTVMGFTVSVHCEDAKDEPLELAELVRSGLMWDSTIAVLDAQGIAIVAEPGQAIPVPVSIDERSTSAWLFEVDFRAEFHRVDPKSQGTIEHVKISGELKKGDVDPAPVTVTIDVDR